MLDFDLRRSLIEPAVCPDDVITLRKQPPLSLNIPQNHGIIALLNRGEYTLKWLADDGLQRLTQSHHDTSLSSTDDGLDGSGSSPQGLSLGQLKLMAQWTSKSSDAGEKSELGAQALLFCLSSFLRDVVPS